ncbi:MAG TPA: CHAT domain-containing protein [Bryobacteraceae bacterium]|nr:CHAT domain-containing protein [Bryobacteraceae bacterium]
MIRVGAWCLLLLGGAAATPPEIEPGQIRTGRLTGAESQAFAVRLESGQAAWATLRQSDADLAVRVVPPVGETVVVDGFESGLEPVSIVAEAAGTWRLEIYCASPCARPSGFELRLVSIHLSGPSDLFRRRATQLSTDAHRLAAKGAAEARRQSLQVAAQAADLWRSLAEPAWQLAVLNAAGETRYSLNEYAAAEQSFRDALPLARGLDDPIEADLLNNIGLCRWRLGFTDEAITALLEARARWQKLPNRTEGEASTLSNLGMLYCQTGDCGEALSYYLEALHILSGLNRLDKEALALHNLGTAYGMLGDNDSAADYIERSLPLFRKAARRAGEGRALMNLGFVRLEQGRGADARRLFEQALPLVGEDRRAQADILNNLCKADVLAGHADRALDFCRRAVDLFRQVPERRGEGAAWNNLGAAQAALGRDDEALASFTRALELRRAVNIPAGIAETLSRMAVLEMDRGRLEPALAYASASVEITESLRARVTAEALRTSYFATKQAGYEAWIDILMRLHAAHPEAGYDGRALEAAERRRARTLIDLLREDRGEIRRSAAPDLLFREQALLRRLNYLTQQKTQLEGRPHTPEQERAVSREIDSALREYEQTEARILAEDSHYAGLLHPAPVTLAQIREQIDPSTALLEYSLGERRSYLWVIRRDSLQTFVLPPRAQIEPTALSVAGLAARYRERRRSPELEREFQAAVRTLRRQVFEPAGAKAPRLLLVADGALEYVPFAALAGGREIVRLPSASTIVVLRKEAAGRKPNPPRVAILADPVFDALDPRVHNRSTPPADTPALPRLPFSRQEAAAIEALVPGARRVEALDFRASKAELASPAVAGCRYVHISTHALIDTARPELSSLVLSQVDENGALRDGQVQLYEIYNLRLPADLVTLSGCRTGIGKAVRGEGLVGLARGFFFAGARSLLVTLWPVEDEATAVFMREFYGRLLGEEHLRPAAALRYAREAVARQARWSDPYFWAGFVLEGEWR